MPLPPGYEWNQDPTSYGGVNGFKEPSREEIDVEKEQGQVENQLFSEWDWQNQNKTGPQGEALPEYAIGWQPNGNADFGEGLKGFWNKAVSNVRASWKTGYEEGIKISGLDKLAAKAEAKGTGQDSEKILSDLKEKRKPGDDNAALWSASVEATKEIFDQAIWGVLEGLSQPAMKVEQAIGVAGHSIDRIAAGEQVTGETVKQDWDASRLAYSQFFDASIYAEMNRRIESGVRPDLAAQEVMIAKPGTLWPELIGQGLLDPLNALSLIGKAGQQVKLIKNAEKAFHEVANPNIAKMLDEGIDAIKGMDEGAAYQKIDELVKSQQGLMTAAEHAQDVGNAANKLDDLSKSYQIGQLTSSGKTAHLANQTSDILMHVVNNSDPDEALEILRGMVKSVSDDAEEAADGVATMMHFADPHALFSEAGNNTTVVLAKMTAKYGDTWLDNIAELKNDAPALTKSLLGKLDEVTEEMFPSVSSMLKAEDEIKAGKVLTDAKAIEKRAALAKRASELPPSVRAATKFHDAAQKVIGPINKVFIGAYMGWSPGYAFRNLSNNSMQLLIDYGPGVLLGKADDMFAKVEKFHGGVLQGAFSEGGQAASLFPVDKITKEALGKETGIKAGIKAALGNLKSPILGVSQVAESNGAKRILAKTYMKTFEQGTRAMVKALTPELKAAGFSDDIVKRLPTYIMQNDGDAVKIVDALRKDIGEGVVDLFNDIDRIDPKYKSFLSDVGKWDDYAEKVLRAPTKEAAAEAAAKMFDEIAQAGDYVFREGKPMVDRFDQFAKMAEKGGLPETRGYLISLRKTESRKAIQAAETILSEADDLGAKLGLQVGTLKKGRGITGLNTWGNDAAKEADRINDIAWKLTEASRKGGADLKSLWMGYPELLPGNPPDILDAKSFRDALWGQYDTVVSQTWAGARDTAIGNVTGYLDDLKAAGVPVKDEWYESIKVAQEGAQQYDNAMVGRFGELIEETPMPYGTRSSQIAQIANKYAIPTATDEAVSAAKITEETAQVAETGQPWQMTKEQWEKAVEDLRADTVQQNMTKASGSQEVGRIQELERLFFGVKDKFKNMFKETQAALNAGKPAPYTPEEMQKAYDQLQNRITYEDVINKAKEEGMFPKKVAEKATKAPTAAGVPTDKKTLQIINKYADVNYKSLEDVPISVAEEAFAKKAGKAVSDASPQVTDAAVAPKFEGDLGVDEILKKSRNAPGYAEQTLEAAGKEYRATRSGTNIWLEVKQGDEFVKAKLSELPDEVLKLRDELAAPLPKTEGMGFKEANEANKKYLQSLERDPDLAYFDDSHKIVEPRKRILPPPSDGEAIPVSRAIHEQMDDVGKMRKWVMDDIQKTFGKKQVVNKTSEAALQKAQKELTQKLAENKLISSRVAQANRDFTLLNYGDKSYWDTALAYLYPFHFWYKGTYKNWFSRIAQNPAVLGNYARYKEHLGTVHAGMPEWWKFNINTNDLPGVDVENPLYFNLEQTLWPLNGITGQDFNDPSKRVNWWTYSLDFANKFGPSTWTPLSMMTGMALHAKGEKEAGESWLGRLIPQTATIKAGASLLGMTNLELDPLVNIYSGGLDKYERRRAQRALSNMMQDSQAGNSQYTPEQIMDAAYSQEGEIWEQAVKNSVRGRAPSQMSSFLFGVGFKGRTEQDMEIDKFYSDYNKLWTMRPNLDPQEFSEGMEALKTKYPFMDTVMLSRGDGVQRDAGLAYNVLTRIPPGKSSDIAKAVGIDSEMMNKFFADKGQIDKWPASDQKKFMAGILDISAILEIPPDMTRKEWLSAKNTYKSAMSEAETMFGKQIWDTVDGYYQAKTQSSQAADAYLEGHPEVQEALNWKAERIMQSPLLSAYYGGAQVIEGYYRNQMYKDIETKLGKEIFTVMDEYNELKTYGEGDEAKTFYNQHKKEIKTYYSIKDEWGIITNQNVARLTAHIPEGEGAQIRQDANLSSLGAQELAGQIQQEQQPPMSFEDFSAVIPTRTMSLVQDYFNNGEQLPESARKQLDRLAKEMGFYDSDELLQQIGSSMYQGQP